MLPTPTKRWIIAQPVPPEIEWDLREFEPTLRQLLFNRGYLTREAASIYLEARAPAGTAPENILGIKEAVDRIQYAINKGQKIAVYGDYDADGVTATALLTLVLKSLDADVISYIPNRFDEGYGLNNEALTNLHQQGVDLVITVDCGVRSLVEAEHAARIGLDLIISDHHHPAVELPHAYAVINPKQPGDLYPEKELAGVGLAYKLAQALFYKLSSTFIRQAIEYLDLVAIGTVTDLAPLRGENRALVRSGLQLLRYPKRQGLVSLIGASGLVPLNLTATEIGFMLGPRLNAAGRLESAEAALRLLLTKDVSEAGVLAQRLDNQNRERQQLMQQIQEKAEEIALANKPNPLLLYAAHPDFNSGIVGLAASRLTEKYYRPAIVAQLGETETRGSCRSIEEFHITEALDQCKDLLVRYGGHKAAAGFTVRNENLQELIDRLFKIVEERLGSLDLQPTLKADLEFTNLPRAKQIPTLLQELDRLQPTGVGNPQAIFISRGLEIAQARTVGSENSHLKLKVTDGWSTYNAIAFRQGYWASQLPKKVDLLYTFEINEYNGSQTLQLNVKDIQPT